MLEPDYLLLVARHRWASLLRYHSNYPCTRNSRRLASWQNRQCPCGRGVLYTIVPFLPARQLDGSVPELSVPNLLCHALVGDEGPRKQTITILLPEPRQHAGSYRGRTLVVGVLEVWLNPEGVEHLHEPETAVDIDRTYRDLRRICVERARVHHLEVSNPIDLRRERLVESDRSHALARHEPHGIVLRPCLCLEPGSLDDILPFALRMDKGHPHPIIPRELEVRTLLRRIEPRCVDPHIRHGQPPNSGAGRGSFPRSCELLNSPPSFQGDSPANTGIMTDRQL